MHQRHIEEQADHTLALLLAVARKILCMAQAMADGAFHRGQELSRSNRRIAGRVLGLVGFGHSAMLVARRALGFELRVIATRRDMAAPGIDGVEMADFEAVLTRSDYTCR